jgi:hypothetical protein
MANLDYGTKGIPGSRGPHIFGEVIEGLEPVESSMLDGEVVRRML